AHMVPEPIVVIDKIPVSATGKADRKNLPAPQDQPAARDANAAAPASNEGTAGELESKIARLWSELLGHGPAGVRVHVNLFDLGGSSLLAVRALARLRQELGLDVSLVDLYAYPTVRTLARALVEARDGGGDVHAPIAAPADASGPIAVIGMSLRFPG